jgi:hypothetical protein
MSYSEDEDYDQDSEFVAEFAARERVGSGRISFIDIKIDQKGKRGRLSLKGELTPDQLFLYDLQKNYYKYDDDLQFTQDEIELIKTIVLRISNIEFKNPLAFIFGFYVLNKNPKVQDFILKDKFSRIKSIIKGVEGVELEDIIRYSRLIHKNLY